MFSTRLAAIHYHPEEPGRACTATHDPAPAEDQSAITVPIMPTRNVRVAIWDALHWCIYCGVSAPFVRVSTQPNHSVLLEPLCGGHADLRVNVYAIDILRTPEGN